jgi:hypothetical protein
MIPFEQDPPLIYDTPDRKEFLVAIQAGVVREVHVDLCHSEWGTINQLTMQVFCETGPGNHDGTTALAFRLLVEEFPNGSPGRSSSFYTYVVMMDDKWWYADRVKLAGNHVIAIDQPYNPNRIAALQRWAKEWAQDLFGEG